MPAIVDGRPGEIDADRSWKQEIDLDVVLGSG
jgi:hypothetical protein